jgi:hypothetical protein
MENPTENPTENPVGNRGITRREFLRRVELMGMAALAVPWLAACAQPAAPTASEAAPASAPAVSAEGATAAEGIKEVARNRTFIAVRGGSQGKFVEWDQWNPFVPVANHQFAVGFDV